MGVVLLALAAGVAVADVITLPLNGSAGFYDINTPAWTMDFDLGVTFSEISHVYIDWSGQITGRTAKYMDSPDIMPMNGGLEAYIGTYPQFGTALVGAGASTYPAPQVFNVQSEFLTFPNWNFLLDGKDVLEIFYPMAGTFPEIHIIDYGSATLNNATLVVDGTVVPEPATLFLLGIGGLSLRRRS